MRPRHVLEAAISFPAILGWVMYGIAFLINPHMAVEVEPIVAALTAMGIYYAIMGALLVVYAVGWIGILLLSATL